MTTRRFLSKPRRMTRAFSMIELLTVIAIIAILAAIIMPVFASVRENARRTSCMSNMRSIHQAIGAYYQDNRSYPEFLFGPATDGVAMRQATPHPNGLFPTYVRSMETFHCPNNDIGNTPNEVVVRSVNRREGTDGAIVARNFYAYSSYEANPAIDIANVALDETTFVNRYSRVWTEIEAAPPADDPPGTSANYERQLIWRNPPQDTYVTMCSYHIPHGKGVVLFLNGQTRVYDTRRLIQQLPAGDPALTDLQMNRLSSLD